MNGWAGPATRRVFAGTACWLADCESFLKKYLRDVRHDMRPNGAVPHFSPDPTRLHPIEGRGDWAGSTGLGRCDRHHPVADVSTLWRYRCIDRELSGHAQVVGLSVEYFQWSNHPPFGDLGRAWVYLRRLDPAGGRPTVSPVRPSPTIVRRRSTTSSRPIWPRRSPG